MLLIVFQLAYRAMDDPNHVPHWAILYGGNEFIIFLVVPILLNDHPRCILISSSVIAINDKVTPFFHLLLLTIITNDQYTQTQLISRLLPPTFELLPQGTSFEVYDASKDSEEVWVKNTDQSRQVTDIPREWIQKGTHVVPDSQSLSRRFLDYDLRPCRLEYTSISVASSVDVSIYPHGPLHIVFSRNEASSQPTYPLSFTHHYTGATSNVYKSDRGVVLKTWIPGYADTLKKEADIYRLLSRTPARSVIPTYLGYFQHGHTQILLLSDVGLTLESFRQPLHVRCVLQHLSTTLLTSFSERLYRGLVLLHEAGIYHDDFCPRNTANGFVMDFSHASQGHQCPGIDQCDELIQARQDLGLDAHTKPHLHFWTSTIVLSFIVLLYAVYQYNM
jgi:hypothetical protein